MRTESLSNFPPTAEKCSSLSSSMLITRLSIILIRASAIDLTKHDVHRADDGDHVGDHVPLGHLVHGGEVREARGADLHAPRLVRPVAHEEDAELAFRVLHRGIRLAR